MKLNFQVEGGNFAKAGAASSEVKKMLKQLGVPPMVIRRIVVALYEAEVNIVAHAQQGAISVDLHHDKVEIRLRDKGPGIQDISRAMQEGFSTASEEVRAMGFGAGMGLPNIKKNADKLHIESQVGEGTTVYITNYFAEP
ncbi:ATP-binding protein [Prolixibacter sp. SD074]|uniref:ATP-binding protein n=2 Tax=Prolixibacter sp. SD074 TaxID=2652391 RepID=UPI00126CF158|nr:ATP-binding protein [Prolixibacter sp. SD074]GET31115.1 hypothetical protein SD074_33170 [Prolixibacter sp. SD074]